MLNPLVILVISALLLIFGGYLNNQLPQIPHFRGRNVLILWLTLKVAVLSLIITGWKEVRSQIN